MVRIARFLPSRASVSDTHGRQAWTQKESDGQGTHRPLRLALGVNLGFRSDRAFCTQYVEFVFNQKVETWLRLHRNAFVFFGGVPKWVVVDNLKGAIIRAVQDIPR